MPSGFKTLGQIAWTPSQGVEALRKKVAGLRPTKKCEGKEWEWERTDDFWFLWSSHWDLCICSDSCVLDSQNHFNEFSFSWSQLEYGYSQFWFRLGFRTSLIILYLPDTNRCTHLFQHHYVWNPLFCTENRVCRPPNTVHQHPGKECSKDEWVYVRRGLSDSWTTLSIYTARARPILSFPRSKTEKYSLRKMSPRIQVSIGGLTAISSKMK